MSYKELWKQIGNNISISTKPILGLLREQVARIFHYSPILRGILSNSYCYCEGRLLNSRDRNVVAWPLGSTFENFYFQKGNIGFLLNPIGIVQ